MAQGLKGQQRRVLRSFSYAGEYDPFIKRVQKRAKKEGLTLSEVIVAGAKLYASKHWPDLERSRSGAEAARVV